MKNSEDRNKKMVILKFLGISVLVLAFVLFYLLYSLGVLKNITSNLSSYQVLGLRPTLMRNAKLLATEYLINPLYAPLPNNTLRALTIGLIS